MEYWSLVMTECIFEGHPSDGPLNTGGKIVYGVVLSW